MVSRTCVLVSLAQYRQQKAINCAPFKTPLNIFGFLLKLSLQTNALFTSVLNKMYEQQKSTKCQTSLYSTFYFSFFDTSKFKKSNEIKNFQCKKLFDIFRSQNSSNERKKF